MKRWIIAGILLFVALLSPSTTYTCAGNVTAKPTNYTIIISPIMAELGHDSCATTPPPAVTTAPVSTIVTLQNNIDAIIAQLPSGKAIFNPPPEMTKNTTNRVCAIINRSNISTGETVKVTPVMEAYLKGSAFNIKDITKSSQIVTNASNTTWFWDVTPFKEGNQTLNLAIYIIIDGDEKAVTYDRTIAVKVNPEEQEANQKREILSIGGTFIFILVGATYFFKDTLNEFVKRRFLR